MEWWRIQCFLSLVVSELIGSFFLGLFAVASSDYAATFAGSPLHIFVYGSTFTVVIFALALTFGQFGAGRFNPAITLLAWLCDAEPFSVNSIIRYLSEWVAQFIGFLAAAFLAQAITGGAPLGCTNVNPALGTSAGAAQALAFVLEFLALLLILHTVALAGLRRKGPLTTLAIGAEFGIFIGIFGPVTGGSFNLFRTLGVGIAEGCLGADIWVYIVSFVLAPIITALLVTYVFPPHCGSQLPKAVLVEKCEMPQPQKKHNC